MDTKRAAAAGVIGTAAMTALLLVEPSIGLPKIAIGEMLSSSMSALSSQTPMGPCPISRVGWLAWAGALSR